MLIAKVFLKFRIGGWLGNESVSLHFQQLRTLARLRNLEPLIDKVMDSVANYMKDENDILFIIGKKQEQKKFVRNLLQQTDFNMSKISYIVGVSLDFVKRVKQKLPK